MDEDGVVRVEERKREAAVSERGRVSRSRGGTRASEDVVRRPVADYFALGGAAPPGQLRGYPAGDGGPMAYDVVAQAINERFVDLGGDHPLPYSEELGNERSS